MKKHKISSPNKSILIALVILIVLAVTFLLVRGKEDTWIRDENGKWVTHGNPSASAPGVSDVKDYISCSSIYPIMKSIPAQCQVPGGEKYYDIRTFDECAMFFPVMETYPEQCRTNDGKSFVKEY